MRSIGPLSQSASRGLPLFTVLTRGKEIQMVTPKSKGVSKSSESTKRARIDATAGSSDPISPKADKTAKSVSVSITSRQMRTEIKVSKAFDLHPLPGFEPPPRNVDQAKDDSSLNVHEDGETKTNKDEESSTKLEGISKLTHEQKMRMELNKGIAQAKRNLRICEEHVAESQKQGKAFPEFQDLLVERSWLDIVEGEFAKPYMSKLNTFVQQEAAGKLPIYPPPALLFNAFHSCPFDKVKVVIIGQDPYHGPGQAMGLCFSVPHGVKIPSSLLNIFKEIATDIGGKVPSHGNLEKWAHQGVLLLNAVFTVREHHPNSHAKKGWEPFTDCAIRAVSQHHKGIVFLLWGNSAHDKTRLIDGNVHHILKAAHPSGLSANKGFFSCRHFSKTNEILEKAGKLPIDWQL